MWLARLRLFVSYRRDDSEASAGRVADALARQFGKRRVFLDTASMPLGQEFVRVLEEELARADVVLVIIGPSWSSIANKRGIRLHQEDDPVRFEVSRALRSGKRVVPVLIDGAQMPRTEELPEDLRAIDKFTFERVRNGSFASDFDALVDGVLGRLRGQLRTERDRLLAWVAGAWGSALLVPAFAIVASLGAWSGAFDYLQLDTRVQRALLPLASRAGETDVMVAAIDADTERALGREWGRDREAWRRGHAEFIDAAAASGARGALRSCLRLQHPRRRLRARALRSHRRGDAASRAARAADERGLRRPLARRCPACVGHPVARCRPGRPRLHIRSRRRSVVLDAAGRPARRTWQGCPGGRRHGSDVGRGTCRPAVAHGRRRTPLARIRRPAPQSASGVLRDRTAA